MDPGFYIAHTVLGEALDEEGAHDAAIVEFQKARALNDDPAVLGMLGRAYGLSGNRMEAEKILDQLKEAIETALRCSLQLCPCLSRTGQQRGGAPLA